MKSHAGQSTQYSVSKTLLDVIIYVEELVILFILSALQYHLVAISDTCILKSYFMRFSCHVLSNVA